MSAPSVVDGGKGRSSWTQLTASRPDSRTGGGCFVCPGSSESYCCCPHLQSGVLQPLKASAAASVQLASASSGRRIALRCVAQLSTYPGHSNATSYIIMMAVGASFSRRAETQLRLKKIVLFPTSERASVCSSFKRRANQPQGCPSAGPFWREEQERE